MAASQAGCQTNPAVGKSKLYGDSNRLTAIANQQNIKPQPHVQLKPSCFMQADKNVPIELPKAATKTPCSVTDCHVVCCSILRDQLLTQDLRMTGLRELSKLEVLAGWRPNRNWLRWRGSRIYSWQVKVLAQKDELRFVYIVLSVCLTVCTYMQFEVYIIVLLCTFIYFVEHIFVLFCF